jgi:hypothetical protein
MQLNKEKADFLYKVIDDWKSQQLLSEEQSQLLKESVTVRKFDWKQVTVYAFIIAVVCGILSVIILLADKPLREIIEKFTRITDFGISSVLTLATFLIFYLTNKRFIKHNDMPFSNQSLLLFGAFLSLATVSYWAKSFHVFHNHYQLIFLLSGLLYLAMAMYFCSPVLWVLSLMMFAFAYGLFTVSYSKDRSQEKFLGMNFPMRYVVFSLFILFFSGLIKKSQKLMPFFRIHYIVSLLFFFISLLLVTIFGNYSDFERWNEIKQTQFILWDVLLFTTTALGMYSGLKRNDYILGNISLLFFIMNLITRYFEYFWIPLHKSIFFMILAFIFWLIGSRAEKLWNLRFLEKE